jgi:hypothetical protein
MTIRLILTTANVALSESTTQMDFGGGDGWAMSQDQGPEHPAWATGRRSFIA